MNNKNTIYKVDERAFFLDCGRKYFSPKWFEKLIPTLKSANLNALYLHFSEEMGLRLESKQFPWLAGGDHTLCVHGSANGEAENDKKFLTQEEMRYIVSLASDYGIEVIPSFDSPGHMNYAVKKYNEHYGTDIGNYFHKNGKRSIVQGSSIPNEAAQKSFSRGIDISNPEAVKFAHALLTEYGELFRSLGAKSFDIGGDELLGFGENIDDSYSKWQSLDHWQALAQNKTGNEKAVAYDAFLLYMNESAELMRSLGYSSVRMWNDDVLRSGDTDWKRAVELDKNIDIEFWMPYANGAKNNVFTYLDEGYKIYNLLNFYTYYVLGAGMKSGITPEQLKNNWNAYVFDSPSAQFRVDPTKHNIFGGAFCLWCDKPSAESPDEILKNITPYLFSAGEAMS
jgi:hexosaminidase